MNERLLIEIAYLRRLRTVIFESERITHCLEILRYIRNTELGISFEEGLKQEDEWMALNGSDYDEHLKNRLSQ